MKIIEAAKQITVSMEARITKDGNGFYHRQMRFLPVEPWEPDEGWMTTYISQIPLTNTKPYPYH